MSTSLNILINKYKNKKLNGLISELKYCKDKFILNELTDITSFLNLSATISERVYCILNKVLTAQLCACDKPLKFHKISRGYAKTCGDKECTSKLRSINSIKSNASRDNIAMVKKTKLTNLKKTGFESNFSKGSSSRKSYDDKMIKLYGHKHALQNDELLKKAQLTTINRHGTLNQLNSIKVLNTIKEKYGVAHPMKNNEIKERSRINSIKTKNIQIHYRIEKMNLSILNESNVFKLKCNKCNTTVSNVTRHLINFYFRQDKTPCQKCNPINHFRSNLEQKLVDDIQLFYDGEIQLNRKYLGTEIDLIFPKEKIAIEVNGIYWHSELYKTPNYHKDKKLKIEKQGYNLIYVWEDDLNDPLKRSIILSRIKNKLGLSTKIYARKTVIKEVSYKDATIFLNNNHIQGNSKSSIRIGLYHNNELVSLSTFSKARNSIGNNTGYELVRNASLINYVIIGGFSKILKHYKQNFNYDMVSYGDCDWVSLNASVYSLNGFKLVSHTAPGYTWQVNGKRENRLNFQKHKLVKNGADKNKTELEIMYELGYYRIWGSGNLKYEWTRL